MLATHDTSHVAEALDRLLEQYRDRPNITSLITALVQPMQDLEDAIFNMDGARQLINPDVLGDQLDGLGALVGIERNGLDDATYLFFIFGQIAINFSSGTIDNIASIAANLFDVDNVHVQSLYPLAVGIQTAGAIDTTLITLASTMLAQAVRACVSIDWIADFDATEAFAFDGGTQPGLGFTDGTQTGTGGFAKVEWRNPLMT